jgi:hypothetical protein
MDRIEFHVRNRDCAGLTHRACVRAYARLVHERQPEKPYHRRYGVIWRPGQLGVPREPRTGLFFRPWVNDGGEDAPLSPRGRAVFRSVLLGIFVVFVLLVILTARGY